MLPRERWFFWYASLRPRARRHNGREHRVVPQLKKGETVCHFAVGVVQFQTQLADVLFSVLLCWLWTLWHCTWKRAYRGCRGMIWLGISESIRADSSGVCWLGHGPNPVKRDKAAAEWWLLGHRGSTLFRPSGSSKSGAGLGGLDTCCWEQSWCHWPTDMVAGAHLRGANRWCRGLVWASWSEAAGAIHQMTLRRSRCRSHSSGNCFCK